MKNPVAKHGRRFNHGGAHVKPKPRDARGACAAHDQADLDDEDLVLCPMCDSLQGRLDAILGRLGGLNHYRCRHCGITWSEIAEDDDD